ncbi:uncharacterized protein LOC143350115 [Colletes latitarsis]|uniref:uncharacterized protein LOC143350115 n=1 Tax=Colletes latitarsis TaxID=2605962 RepID=UPI0040357FE2
MEKAIKHLIVKSINLRSWTTLSNYIATHNLVINYENQQDPSLSKKWGVHKENIQKNTFLDSNNNSKNMIENNGWNSKQTCTIEAINHLTLLYDCSNCEHIRNSKEFKQLCRIIQRNVKFLNSNCIIHVLKILLHFGVPPETTIIQTLLQFIKFYINDLSIKELTNVYYLLQNEKKLPLVKSLLHALPIVFYNQLQIELDKRNMITLSSAFIFACNIKHLETLTDILNMLSKNKEILTIELVKFTLYALYLLPEQSININLLYRVFGLIIDKGQLLKFKEINFLLFLITSKIADRNMNFYNNDVLCTLCNAALNKNLAFGGHELILKKLNKIYYSNIPLLNHATTRFIEDPYYLTSYSQFQIYTLIRALSNADYKPQSWVTMQSMLLKYFFHTDYSIHYLAVNAFHLLSLDCYNAELLEKIFTIFYCTHDNVKDHTKVYILKLYQAVKTLYPSYNGVTLSENLLNNLMEQVRFIKTPELGEILKKVVGGAQFIKSGLTTKVGHFIDYAIIIQPDGSPMVLNDLSNNIFAEELVSPPGYSKLFVLAFPIHAYCINTQQLTSTWRMQKQSLETLIKCKAVVINIHLWNKFSEDRQKLYLEDVLQIKSKKIS